MTSSRKPGALEEHLQIEYNDRQTNRDRESLARLGRALIAVVRILEIISAEYEMIAEKGRHYDSALNGPDGAEKAVARRNDLRRLPKRARTLGHQLGGK